MNPGSQTQLPITQLPLLLQLAREEHPEASTAYMQCAQTFPNYGSESIVLPKYLGNLPEVDTDRSTRYTTATTQQFLTSIVTGSKHKLCLVATGMDKIMFQTQQGCAFKCINSVNSTTFK